ncbi:MAG TPA: DUF72 domain-containing protein [Methylophilaceae bacterium]|nr:DUF72 domain-containing protein [Methylophilaceae bacterium]
MNPSSRAVIQALRIAPEPDDDAVYRSSIHIGCASWSIPALHGTLLEGTGSHLERYASVFDTAEINSSFHRSHQQKTYARWAASVPEHFTFTVKMPKEITHIHKLVDCEKALTQFLDETSGLGQKLAVVLIQLPPKLHLDSSRATDFFAMFRSQYSGLAACEPRHADWFSPEGDSLLRSFQLARVAADPAPRALNGIAFVAQPGGWDGFRYFRLHGSPQMYASSYSAEFLQEIACQLAQGSGQEKTPAWCIFDNTSRGAAIPNALDLMRLVQA